MFPWVSHPDSPRSLSRKCSNKIFLGSSLKQWDPNIWKAHWNTWGALRSQWAQRAHAGTEGQFGVDSSCPLVSIFDILPSIPCKYWPKKKKINNQSKKEMENFIWANLRIRTWEIAFQKALRTLLPVRVQGSYISFWNKGLYIEVTY